MYWLKSCPRCSGDLVVEDDIYGKDVMCVQCGFRPAPLEIVQLSERIAAKRERARVRKLAKLTARTA